MDMEMEEAETNDDFADQRDNDSSNYDYDGDDDYDYDDDEQQIELPTNPSPLPLKFRFGEQSKTVEKSEYEEMLESLFDEYLNCELEELGSFNCPKVHLENEPPEETQHARCTRGDHELLLQDDQGWFCVYCHHVAVGPNYVLPQCGRINLEATENQASEFTSFPERGTDMVDSQSMSEGVLRSRKKAKKDMDGHLGHPYTGLGVASRTRSKMRTIRGLWQDVTVTLDSTDDSVTSTDSSQSCSSDFKIKVDKPSHFHSNKSKFTGSHGAKNDTQRSIPEMSGHRCKGVRSAAAHALKRELTTEDEDHRTDCNLHALKRQKKSERKLHAHDDFDHDDGCRNSGSGGHKKQGDRIAEIFKMQTKGGKGSSKDQDICKILADSILEKNQTPETEQAEDHNALPVRFKFEEEQNEEAKSESEPEEIMENLFDELDFCWELEKVGSFNCPKDELDDAHAEETQYERCKRGKHELIIEDEKGQWCVYCGHVELGPKDVLPEWGKKNSGSARRTWFETEDLPDFDAISSQPSLDDYIDLRCGSVWNIKPGIRESMYEHQQEGFEFLWKNLAGSINIAELKSTNPSGVGGCIISHAPGTGKTRLTIVFIETYLKMFPNCRPVIIAPASMLLTWEEEFRKWNVKFPLHNLNNVELSGKENSAALRLLTGSKRENQDSVRMVKIYSWNTGSSILGISYSLFEKLTGEKYMNVKGGRKNKDNVIADKKVESLRQILLEKPGLVVLDEGHTPRNQRSNIWNVLQKLETEKRVILSGTPFQNNFGELFNTLRIVRPAVANALAQEKPFAEMITSRRMSSRKQGESSCSSSISKVIDRAVEKLKISMSPFVHVHKGTILQKSLPGLRDSVVLLKPSPLQKAIIEKLEGLQSTFKSEHVVALSSVHPYLFQHCDPTDEQKAGIDMEAVEACKLNPNEGVKTKFILEFARLSVAMNEKILIFSQYLQPLELIKEQMKQVFKWTEGMEILQLRGKLDQKQRQILINLFNDPQSESKIMLASTRCCSEGISLVGASRVIILDVGWNPSVERQAICRAYRIGQKKFVHTYHLMTSGTTEADKYCRQAEKERLSELVFSATNESYLQNHNVMSFEDTILEEMVAHEKLKEMFEKIINQPKDTDLSHSFGLPT